VHLKGICFITDRTYCSLSPYEMCTVALNAGIRFIQYRDKDRTRREIYYEAVRLRELTRSFEAVLIINDHADIALAVDADGVHLGQDDLPLEEARKIMRDRIIGISTHDLEQAREAESGGADYIGFGPVFETLTKDAGSPKGIDNLRLITQNITVPVVAIGGINGGNLRQVLDAGADAAAVATAICKGDIEDNARRLVSLVKDKNLKP
jgi:thiamine-phosphate pyrophosphorylase